MRATAVGWQITFETVVVYSPGNQENRSPQEKTPTIKKTRRVPSKKGINESVGQKFVISKETPRGILARKKREALP